MYDSKAIANYFLDVANSDGKSITPLKMQKLVYFAHGWNLAIKNSPLLNERVEAWKFGPVIPTLYHHFKGVGGNPIRTPAVEVILTDKGNDWVIEEPAIDTCGPEENAFTRRLLDRIWKVYGRYSGEQLSAMTHQEGTPWRQIHDRYGNVKGIDIPDDLIRKYFVNQAKKTHQDGRSATAQ